VKFMYSRALVTGGAGFVGSHIVDRLVRDGFEVKVLDDLSRGHLENLRDALGSKHAVLVKGSVCDSRVVDDVVDGVDVVFHEAAFVDVAQSVKDPILANDVNVNGTLNLLEASMKHKVKRFVLASSAAVYGDQGSVPVREDVLPRPCSPYAASKLSAEFYSGAYYSTHGLESVALRYFNVYGERQTVGPYSAVITAFLNGLMGDGKPVIHGDGLQTRDFVHVSDVVEANMLALRKNCAGEVFNVASGCGVNINDLFNILRNLAGKRDVQPEHANPREGDIRESCGDISKISRVLGFKPKISLEEGLESLPKSWRLERLKM
jgi:nucleoside-diphosphate-sugar epimerase